MNLKAHGFIMYVRLVDGPLKNLKADDIFIKNFSECFDYWAIPLLQIITLQRKAEQSV